MNILIISGGSGNDALVKGIKSIYPSANVKVLVNAYDAGKSTGVCRHVTDTLGVSDIRKNHERMYKAMCKNINKCYAEFYSGRFDFTKGNEVNEITKHLVGWGLDEFVPFVERFFENEKASHYEYRDFSVSNIVYAQMYKECGYEYTNAYFCRMLGLDDFVILNSFDNVYIEGITQSGNVIHEEGDLVEYKNPDDKIVKMNYVKEGKDYGLNPVAIKAVEDADLIVVSTGTFWSSIYPTFDYLDFYKYINRSTAKKIWAINNNEDKDAYGVSANEFIEHFERLGLILDDFTILENNDAVEILRQKNDKYNVVFASMGNTNGKHDGYLYACEVMNLYYGLSACCNYNKIIFDFDDTLWSRVFTYDPEEHGNSVENLHILNETFADKAIIVSGNSYSSIHAKLASVYGSSLDEFNVPIWADANSSLFVNGKRVATIDKLAIDGDIDEFIEDIAREYDLTCTKNSEDFVSCLKIKPLAQDYRRLLLDYLNDYLLDAYQLNHCVAKMTGATTVDIVSTFNTKAAVFREVVKDGELTLYIGDELDGGNDTQIAKLCTHAIHTSGVNETNALLKLLKTNALLNRLAETHK